MILANVIQIGFHSFANQVPQTRDRRRPPRKCRLLSRCTSSSIPRQMRNLAERDSELAQHHFDRGGRLHNAAGVTLNWDNTDAVGCGGG